MKLQDPLPNGVKVGRRFYRMDFDFRRVLRMLDELSRDDLLPEAREYRALHCLMKRPPRKTAPVLAAVRALLFPEAPVKREKLTDFVQDADLIRAAFLQAFGINLYTDQLHWLIFTGLLSCMPEGSRYSEILGIRARPMPAATKWNAEERRWLAQAKVDYAVRLTDKERADRLADGLRGVAMSLLHLADGGGQSE